jgi:prepilin-type N-terminal cleavage/methylation domain-containing protein
VRRSGRGQNGFTLIELLVSLAIFAIISVAVYSSFAAGIRVWRRTQEFSSIYQTARLLLEDMARELKNAAPIPGTEFVGEREKLSFVTSRPSPSGTGHPAAPRVTRVTYKVRKPRGASGYSLFRSETADVKNADGGGREQALFVDSVSRFSLQYTYVNSDGGIVPWKDAWDESHALPLGVRITLMIGETRFTKLVFIPHGFREKQNERQG